jgi:hypothetical protein
VIFPEDGNGQLPKHEAVLLNQELIQLGGDELIYMYQLHGKCTILSFQPLH